MDTPLAASANEPLQMLAAASARQGRFEVRSVSVGEDGQLAVETPAPPSRFRFTFHGVVFHVRLSPLTSGFRLHISSVLGHIPFTAEGAALRNSVIETLRAAAALDRVKFVVTHGQQVVLMSNADVMEPSLPEVVLHEASIILHQARPFMTLLQSMLRPAIDLGHVAGELPSTK